MRYALSRYSNPITLPELVSSTLRSLRPQRSLRRDDGKFGRVCKNMVQKSLLTRDLQHGQERAPTQKFLEYSPSRGEQDSVYAKR